MSDLISIIIRTKNEERWITQCLREVFNQDYKDFEVIIVDSESSDKTLQKARQFNIAKIITCNDYLPGKALNMGIKESKGKAIVSLSGHCIPTDEKWLSNLYRNLSSPDIAGVYGRQEPMTFTPPSDKRDLTLVFGLDKKIQVKDSFFHNANSMIRRDIWDLVKFDEKVTNIEDRVWAQRVLQKGFKIIYEPEASVYHYHGIHQDGNPERCANVVRILEDLNRPHNYKSIEVEKLNIVALIPVKGPIQYLNSKPLISYTIQRAVESNFIKKVIVSTDDKELAQLATSLGADAPFTRDRYFSKEYIDIVKVLQYTLQKLEEVMIYPDLIVSLEVTFPFRPKGLLDDMILQLAKGGFDTVIAAKRENKSIWKEKDGRILQIENGITPRHLKEPSYIGLKGVGCITYPEFIRSGELFGAKIGIYEVNNPFVHLEVREPADFAIVSTFIDRWFD